MSEATPERRRQVIGAWLLVGGFAGLVLWLGGARFDVDGTDGLLAPILGFLFPELNASERYLLHLKVRKTAHAVEYGVLALLALRAAFITFRRTTLRVASLALGLAVAVAAADEARQAFLPQRTGSLSDVLLDAAGAGVAVALALALRALARRREGGAPA